MAGKISDDVVMRIKEMRANGKKYKEISEALGVSESFISYVVRGITTEMRTPYMKSKKEIERIKLMDAIDESDNNRKSDIEFLAEAIIRLSNKVDRLEILVSSLGDDT